MRLWARGLGPQGIVATGVQSCWLAPLGFLHSCNPSKEGFSPCPLPSGSGHKGIAFLEFLQGRRLALTSTLVGMHLSVCALPLAHPHRICSILLCSLHLAFAETDVKSLFSEHILTFILFLGDDRTVGRTERKVLCKAGFLVRIENDSEFCRKCLFL